MAVATIRVDLIDTACLQCANRNCYPCKTGSLDSSFLKFRRNGATQCRAFKLSRQGTRHDRAVLTPVSRHLEQEPSLALGLVNPVFQETGSDVAVLVANV